MAERHYLAVNVCETLWVTSGTGKQDGILDQAHSPRLDNLETEELFTAQQITVVE